MLQINLLGSFSIRVDGRRIHSDLGPSGQRMAAFLFAFPGRLHRRERIADLFWRDMSLDRSRAALNSALWRLRKILSQDPCSSGGRNLKSIGDDIVLEPEPWMYVDAGTICGLATTIERSVTQRNAIPVSAIKEAIDIYHGAFLEAEEESFFVEERERIHTCFVSLAHYALDHYISVEDYPHAISVCRKVLSFDPYREFFVRSLIGLLCLNEQRAEAARFFERWQRTLREEVGVGPMPETLRFLELVRQCSSRQDLLSIRSALCPECHFGNTSPR